MRWARVALGVGGLITVAGSGAVMWPLWADGKAKEETLEWMERRFEEVSIGSFVLERHEAVLRDVSFVEDGVAVHLDHVLVRFDLDWSQHVTVSAVDIFGGTLIGPVFALYEKQKTPGTEPTQGEPRVSVRDARFALHGLRVTTSEERISGEVTVAGTFEQGAVDITLSEGRVQAHGREVEFESATAAFEKDAIFPLHLKLEGVSMDVTPEFPVSGVGGDVVLADANATRIEVDLRGLGNEDAAWMLSGSVNRETDQGRVEVSTEGFRLGQFPEFYAALPVADSEQAQVQGNFTLNWAEGVFDVEGMLAVEGVSVSHPMLATTPVRNVAFETAFTVSVIPSKRFVEVKQAVLRSGKVVLTAKGTVSDAVDAQALELQFEIPEARCQDVLNAIPTDLVPGLSEFKLGGQFSMGLHVTIIPARPEATVLRGTVGIDGCKVLHVPEAVSNLDGAFVYDVRRKDGVTQSQVMADGVPTFARFDEIAPTMAAAVLTTEDGGFWKHDGFLRSQFEASLRRNVEVGRIKRGASTLTMQMVKNLLLSHERTLSRKIQELFLTWVIEKRLSKKRILEIYLNAVEFGPGIYGVVSAAQHYFGKLPADLNGKEAAFLATMLPSPVRRHDQWCRGAPTPAYAAKVDRVFKIMHDRKRIDDLTWELDRDILLEFSPQEWPGERACRADDAALLKADGVQWAESGLLAGRSTGVSALTPEDLLEELPEE